MTAPRVLIVLGTEAAWSRGVLRGFMAVAHERDWTLLHYYPGTYLNWVADEWAPAAVVFGPDLGPEAIARLSPAALVSVTVDRSASRIASVCLDEEGIAALALEHLLTRGFRHVSTFRYDESAFAVAREHAFIEQARVAGAEVAAGWGNDDYTPSQRHERPAAMVAWLRSLPKPCGIFTCTDGWGHTVARYTREAGLRVPEDIALVGADNDVLECELLSPPLSVERRNSLERSRPERGNARTPRARESADRGKTCRGFSDRCDGAAFLRCVRGQRPARRPGRYLDPRARRPPPDCNDGGPRGRWRAPTPRAALSARARPHDSARDPARPRGNRQALARDDALQHGRSRETKRLHQRIPAQRGLPARARHGAWGVPPSGAEAVG
jgi:hypothetical protein